MKYEHYDDIERMDEKGYSIDDICIRFRSIPRWKIIDTLQVIHGKRDKRKAWERRQRGE